MPVMAPVTESTVVKVVPTHPPLSSSTILLGAVVPSVSPQRVPEPRARAFSASPADIAAALPAPVVEVPSESKKVSVSGAGRVRSKTRLLVLPGAGVAAGALLLVKTGAEAREEPALKIRERKTKNTTRKVPWIAKMGRLLGRE